MLNIDKKSFKGIGIYNIGYISIKKIDDCIYIHSVHWFLTLQMKIKVYLKKYNDAFNEIRDKIKEINSDERDYEKDYVKLIY